MVRRAECCGGSWRRRRSRRCARPRHARHSHMVQALPLPSFSSFSSSSHSSFFSFSSLSSISSSSSSSASFSPSSSSSSVLRAWRRADLPLLQSVSAASLCGGPERAWPAAAHRRRCLKPKDQKCLFFRLKIVNSFHAFVSQVCVCR